MPRRPRFLLVLALLSACAAVAVWYVAFHVARARHFDASALSAFAGVVRPPLTPSIRGLARFADPLPFVLGGLLLVGVALQRRRYLMAAVVPVILLSANVFTHLLKPALTDPRVIDWEGASRVYPGSWPSGHATASMSLALCLVLVVGPRLRPVAALLGAGYAIGIGYSLVSAGWHLPSDVLGGYLVAATFTLVGAAVLAALESRAPVVAAARDVPIPWTTLAGPIAAMAGVAVLVSATAIVRDPDLVGGAVRHTDVLLVIVGIGALGLALTAGLAMALRR
ncbi:MAG: hypothetical protein QOE11_3419 [Solirubrobacteraceae bacterium]|nr:hypothetical protein [Solirubrobacteraceae bacterium]